MHCKRWIVLLFVLTLSVQAGARQVVPETRAAMEPWYVWATFVAGPGGYLIGTLVQKRCCPTDPVLAVPDDGYRFDRWEVEETGYCDTHRTYSLWENPTTLGKANFCDHLVTAFFSPDTFIVKVSEPADGATVAGQVPIKAAASDDQRDINRLRLFIDEQKVVTADAGVETQLVRDGQLCLDLQDARSIFVDDLGQLRKADAAGALLPDPVAAGPVRMLARSSPSDLHLFFAEKQTLADGREYRWVRLSLPEGKILGVDEEGDASAGGNPVTHDGAETPRARLDGYKNVTYDWDTRTAANGTHSIKAVATNADNVAREQKITVLVANPVLTLAARRIEERSFFSRRAFAKIDLSTENLDKVTVSRISLLRSVDGGGYLPKRDIPLSEIRQNACVLFDLLLQGKHSYSYLVVAFDASGNELAHSNEASL